jgi:hypothetical protein
MREGLFERKQVSSAEKTRRKSEEDALHQVTLIQIWMKVIEGRQR